MPKTHSNAVGIYFSGTHIYAVAVRAGNTPDARPTVTQVASTELPKDCIKDGEVTAPELLAAALRKMLEKNSIASRTAVLGLPSRAVITRQITIPPVAPKDRRLLVRGEIEHLNVLPPGMGVFDFIGLEKPDDTDSKGEPQLFFAASRHAIEGYRHVAADAGLRLIALEPAGFAALRTAYPDIAAKPLAVGISLGQLHTTLVFFRSGKVIYARRLDIGIQNMTTPEKVGSATGEEGGWHMFGEDELREVNAYAASVETPGAKPPPDAGVFGDTVGKSEAAREALSIEIGRSLEYFRRQYHADVDEAYMVMLPNDLDLSGLPVYLSSTLEQDVRFFYTFEHVSVEVGLPENVLQSEGVVYAPALGLALGALGGRFAAAPRFDLSVEDAEVVRAREAPRKLATALATGVGLLLLGTLGSFLVEQQHAPIRTELATQKVQLAALSTQEQTLLAAQEEHQNLVYRVRSQNISWTNVLRYLGDAIPGGVGLTSVNSQTTTALNISARARGQNLVPLFWERLNASPFFVGANVPNIASGNDEIVTFQINVNLPQPPPLPAAPKTLEELVDTPDLIKPTGGKSLGELVGAPEPRQ